jgi:hypothetical protein
MGAGSLFKTAGLRPGVVELAAKGELAEADGGLFAEPNSSVGAGTGFDAGEESGPDDPTVPSPTGCELL